MNLNAKTFADNTYSLDNNLKEVFINERNN